MRTILFLLITAITFPMFAQVNFSNFINEKKKKLIKDDRLSEDEVTKGLVEALIRGSKKSVQSASSKDGFNKNELIRIPFPKEANRIKESLVKLGMQNQVKNFEVRINYAAELASNEALPIFINAIKSIHINDAFSILKGNKTAATGYLEKNTYSDLYNKFKPVVQSVISETELTRYWNKLTVKYNKIPFTKPVSTDLDDYVTRNTIKGLFILIAEEEKSIRDNPLLTGSDLLIKVFN